MSDPDPKPIATEGEAHFMEPTRRGVSRTIIADAPHLKIAVWFDDLAFALTVEDARKLAKHLADFCDEAEAEAKPSS